MAKKLKQENDELRNQVEVLTREISALKEAISKSESSAGSADRRRHDGRSNEALEGSRSDEVSPNDMQFLSDEYDDLNVFRQSVTKQLQSIEMKLQQIGARVEELANAIDAFEMYSYQYNLKIVGLPSAAEQESPSETLNLCLRLFQAMGVREISATEIDIAHRVPTRRASSSREGTENEATRPNPVICKFNRRLAKEKVLEKRKETANIKLSDIGLSSDATIQHLAVYEHLTPKLQELLFEAKKFQRSHKYEFCWAKGSAILLRASSGSRVIKLRTMSDLDHLIRRETR